jgi:hypothetical protein
MHSVNSRDSNHLLNFMFLCVLVVVQAVTERWVTYDVPNRSSAKGKQPVRLEVNDLCYFPLFIQDLRLVVLSLHVVFRKRNTFMVLTGLHVLLMLLVYILIHTKL